MQLLDVFFLKKRYVSIAALGILVFAFSTSAYTQQISAQQKNTEDAQALATAYADVGRPLTQVHTAKQHGGENQNWTSIQTADGLIYVGHTMGITQWDGEQWLNFRTPHATPVRSFTEFDDVLYYGTHSDLFSLKLNAAGEATSTSLLPLMVGPSDDFGDVWSVASNEQGVLFNAARHTYFFDGQQVHQIPNSINSKHGVFTIDDDFLYKPRHLPHIYRLHIVSTGRSFKYVHTQTEIALPENARVMEIIKSEHNHLIVFTERHGVFKVAEGSVKRVITPEQFADDVQIYDAILSSTGFYYVSSTYSGLFVLDSNLNIVRQYKEVDGISMDTVFSVNEDRQGNIWLTGIPNVVKMRPPHIISQYKTGNTSTEILRLVSTSKGTFATGNGQFILNMPSNAKQTPSFTSMSKNIDSSSDLIEIDDIIVKSGYGGISELRLNQDNTYIESETILAKAALGRTLTKDQNGYVIASSSDSAFLLKRQNQKWDIQPFPDSMGALLSAIRDANDTLWIGSPTGTLFKLDNISEQGVNASIQTFDEKDGLGLGPVEVFNVNGRGVFSSEGKLFVYSDTKLKDVTLLSSDIPVFNEQWLNGARTVDRIFYEPKSEFAAERIWYRKYGRSGYFEKQGEAKWLEQTAIFDSVEAGGFNDLFITSDNILWFVRNKAEIYRVDIELAKQIPPIAPVNIRKVQVNQKSIDFQLTEGKTPELLAQQNNLRFSFASSDSSSPEPIKYRSRLTQKNTGVWSVFSKEAYRDFTQLSPGTYTFEVQAQDAWQRKASASLRFTIIAPWYLTTTAYWVFIILALLGMFLFAYIVQKWRTKALAAANLELEIKIEERTKEVSEKVELLKQQQTLKDRFFGNVSHEFRTPLTLTIGPLETLVTEHKGELSKAATSLTITALNNANKMLALVGQVLDLNRLEAGKLPLRIAKYDVAELLRNISERFESWATQHNQTIQVLNCKEPLLFWFDMDQFDKCVSNLLSNSIKYSGENTTIEVQLTRLADYAEVKVRDNGVGISELAKDKIFERFYQDKSSEHVSTPGTGIGLALVQEIMELHHGSVRLLTKNELHADSTEAKGCCFALMLKVGNKHFDFEQIIEPINIERQSNAAKQHNGNNASDISKINSSVSSEVYGIDSDDVTTLLIVDDNKELLNFISLRLSASYRIIQAINGQEGYEKACTELPDLIISDVSMPIMTGLELAEKIKTNKQTQTIPIILLTAKATKREVVEGFSVGADDYLTKPFDTSELIMRVNALINARKIIRESTESKKVMSVLTSQPENFQSKLNNLIEQQLVAPTFNVQKLAAVMHMSRDTLIRKCKKECGDTPLNLIVKKRIEKADGLLKEHSVSVSEVAYACGFESLAYFSKSYKKHRGISPSDAQSQ